MKTILDLSYTKARKFLLEPENYCTMGLPQYIDFSGVLNFVQTKVGNKDFNNILKNKKEMPSAFEDVNYKILMKKNDIYSYRVIQLANPYLYYLLVKKITTKNNWDEIKRRFRKFHDSHIEVVSFPKVKGIKDKSNQAAAVSFWWEGMEQRSIELALQYRYMFITDISNCYPSIYTHSIAWAMMGKTKAKAMKCNGGQLGNEIDTYIQGMQYGQTNGIPQGSTLFDLIAEIVLGYADKILSLKLAKGGIVDYKILRYRDDYRIFSNSKSELETIAFLLQQVLCDLNLQLNSKKTILTEEVITDSVKPDKIWYIASSPFYHKNNKRVLTMASSLQQEALYIHQFSKRYPNSGMLTKLLTMFGQRLKCKFQSYDNINVLISIFTDISLTSPKSYKVILMIISILLNKLTTTVERESIVNQIYAKFQCLPNIGELQIWLQRITFQLPTPIVFKENLCKIVANEPNVKLWNNDWVATQYKTGFPMNSICDTTKRDILTPVIDIDEVSLFNDY